jgi:hypothetical protein
MKEETVTDALLREFLLGKVDDEEKERIESLFVTDSQARERILTAEQDLIEEYLEGSLTTADRERFLSRYAQTPAQQQQLRITKTIKDWAVREADVERSAVSSRRSLRARLRLKPAFFIPIAVAATIAIVVVALWLGRIGQRESRRWAIEQELARLNTPSSLDEVPPQMVSLDLSPVNVRSAQSQTELKKKTGIQFVELRLLWMQKERYPSYNARLRRIGDEGSFTVRNVKAIADGKVIRMRLPANILTRGTYQVEVVGIAADGTVGSSEEYTFIVSD